MKKQSCVRWEWVVAVLVAAMATSAGYAEGRPWSRTGKVDVYFAVQMLGSDKVTAFDGGLEIESDTAPAFGAGVGLNLNNHLNINTELLAADMDLVGTSSLEPGEEGHLGVTGWLWNVNVDYNILKGRLTPLLTGGAGVFGWRSDEVRETNFSYNFGAGARWDVWDHLSLKVTYRITRTEIEDADDPFQFDGVAFQIIYLFP